MKFSYTAKTKSGETISGLEDASDKFELARRLRVQGSTVTAIHEAEHETQKVSLSDRALHLLNRVKLEEKIFFTNNLSAMLSAGLSLSRALTVLRRQTRNPVFIAVLDATAKEIDKGASLSEALAHHPEVFDSVFTAMVSAGEGSGKLPDSLKLLGEQMSKTYALRRKIRGAMVYPAIILLAMSLVAVLMLVVIVPTLAETFAELKIQLPLSTRIIIGASEMVASYGVFLIILFIFAAYGLRKAAVTVRGKRLIDMTILHLPMIAPIVRSVNAAVTGRTLSSLVSSGVDILAALEITKKVVQNSYYRAVLSKAQLRVQKVGSLAAIFQEETKLYPPLLGEMIEVGEETGALSDMLLRVAIFYETEVDSVTKDLSTVIEPFLMIVIGAAVLFFAVSMIQPIYNISSAI